MLNSTVLPTVEELNSIQEQYTSLRYDAPQAEKDRVSKLMKKTPTCYVSGVPGGFGQCVIHGMPVQPEVSFDRAMQVCASHGGRTDIAWNGALVIGKWYSL